MHNLLQDLRYGLRMLWKHPAYTLIAVVTLTLGIGANTAIFSIVNAVLLKPLAIEDPDRVMFMTETRESFGEMSVAYPNYLDWRVQQTSFESMGVWNASGYTLTGQGAAELLRGANASAELLTVLKAKPLLGRLFAADEDQVGATPVVILSYRLWERRFGKDPAIINRTITLNQRAYTVIGVMPANFFFPREANTPFDLWLPVGLLAAEQNFQRRDNHPGLYVLARLKPTVSLEQAQADLRAIAQRLAMAYPASNAGNSIVLRPLKQDVVGAIERALWVMLAAVACVLLIACANVANLLLARGATRKRELAIRLAMGASRGRIARQLITESLLLALIGGLLGILLAQWSIDLLLKFDASVLPRTGEIKTDLYVLGFTFVVTVLTGVLFGLVPVFQIGRHDTQRALKETGRNLAVGKTNFRNALIVAEVALTLILLIGAGLLLRSFSRLLHTDPGFAYEGLLTFNLALSEQKYPQLAPQIQFFQSLEQRLLTVPGVTHVAWSSGLPLGNNGWQQSFTLADRPIPPPVEIPSMEVTVVSPGYLGTMKIPLREGRWFTERDNRDHLQGRDVSGLSPVQLLLAGLTGIVIDEEFARRYWPNESAVGKRVRLGTEISDPIVTVLGVVGRVKMDGLREESSRVQAYLSYLQGTVPNVAVTLRTSVEPQSVLAAVRAQVQALDPQQPMYLESTMENLRASSVATDRMNVLLLGVFAGLALVLALIGLYGVMSYTVTQRTQEVGIRMALGAQSGDVLKLVVGHGMKLVGLGIGLGFILSLALTRLMARLLYGVSATDPLTFTTIVSLFIFVALCACLIPARRAAKVDPMVALRCDS